MVRTRSKADRGNASESPKADRSNASESPKKTTAANSDPVSVAKEKLLKTLEQRKKEAIKRVLDSPEVDPSPQPTPSSSPNKKTISASPKSADNSTTASPNGKTTKAGHKQVADNKTHFEFGGPIGAIGVIFGLPIVIFALHFLCNKEFCVGRQKFSIEEVLKHLPALESLISRESLIMYFGWMAFHIFLERFLPGETVEGVQLKDGSKLKYTLSGHLQFWLCLLCMGHAVPDWNLISGDGLSGVYGLKSFHPLDLSLIYDHYVQLIAVSVAGAALLSVYLYARSFTPGAILAKGGNTGYAVYDFFIGRELNPRIGSLDLKEFCELRPGLIGWFTINLGMAVKQYSNVKSVSASMVLVTLFQGIYVWDALYQERAILTTMDITTDGFGYMLAFGDLAWVPFIYSLQARYLVDHDPHLPLSAVLAISALHFAGFYIFRAANSQKDAFRRDPEGPEVKHLTFLKTKRGTKLITSGWWGLARKINYTGDWLVTLSWCLLCGFQSPIPYFQAVYFLILLIHRAIRDDHMCAEKYGDDWAEYKRRVPYMFIPYVV